MQSMEDFEDIRLPDSHRQQVRLGDLWANNPAVLIWLRHYR